MEGINIIQKPKGRRNARPDKSSLDLVNACYRNFWYDWRTVCPIAAGIMDALPKEGPISYKLFYFSLLHCVTAEPKILTVRSHSVVVSESDDGSRALHVTADKHHRRPFLFTWYDMWRHYDEWLDLEVGMDLNGAVNNAYSVNAVAMATGLASRRFDLERVCTPTVTLNLTPAQQAALVKEVDCKIQFLPSQLNTTDHPLLAACRELIRQDYDHHFNVRQSKLKTLVVGAAWREVRMYQSKPDFSFYFALKEAKDVSRVNINALDYAKTEILKGLAEAEKRLTKKAKNKKSERLRESVEGISNLLMAAKEKGSIPGNFYTEVPVYDSTTGKNNFEQLLCEDVGYNFSESDWLSLFSKTNAEQAIGYLFMPLDLYFDDMAPNNIYMYRERDVLDTAIDGAEATIADYALAATKATIRSGFIPEAARLKGKMSQVAFAGHSNGYTHRKSSWSLLLRKTVLTASGYDFALSCEITSRIGPMITFRMNRVSATTSVVRYLAVPKHLKFVRVLNLMALLRESKRTRSMIRVQNYEYFSVRQEEWLDAVNYAASLDEKSSTIQNLIVYIRRRMGGASLVSKELIPAWSLLDVHVIPLAQTVFYYVKSVRDSISEADDTIMRDKGSWWRRLLDILVRPIAIIAKCVSLLWSWMYSHGILERLVLTPEMGVWQDSGAIVLTRTKDNREYVLDEGHIDLNGDDSDIDTDDNPNVMKDDKSSSVEEEEDTHNIYCDLCSALAGKLGEQSMICDHKEPTYHDFSLTEKQLTDLKMKLFDTDKDPEGLAKVKRTCREHLPVAAFSHKARVHYIAGGPGTGKSYIIRLLAGRDDCVLAPFSKLKGDYEKVDTSDGFKVDLNFKTPHRAVGEAGHRVLLVDEFGAYPYELLAAAVNNCAAEVVYLVGDIKQTKIREPTEGLCTINHIDFDNVQTHTLQKNFRNPPDAVEVCNRFYGYDMVGVSGREEGYYIDDIGNIKDYGNGHSIITYTEMAGTLLDFEEKNTVRKNQGGTFDKVALVLTSADKNLMAVDELAIVALTRHREECVFLHDGSDVARGFLTRLGLLDVNKLMALTGKSFGEMGRHKCESLIKPEINKKTESNRIVLKTGKKSETKEVGTNPEKVKDDEVTVFKAVGITDLERYANHVEAGRYEDFDYCRLDQLDQIGKPTEVLPVGKTSRSGKIALSLNSEDIATNEHIVSQLTGAILNSKEMVIISDESPIVENFLQRYNFGRGFADHVSNFIGDIHTDAIIKPQKEATVEPVMKMVHPGYDAYLLVKEELSAGPLEYELGYLNQEASNVINDSFSGGTLDTSIICPTNIRGHPVKQEKVVWKLSVGPSMQYYSTDHFQMMQCMQARYLIKAADMAFSVTGLKLAQDIGNRFANECLDTDFSVFQHEDIQTVVNNAYGMMVTKNYEKQVDMTDGGTKARTCRFDLKEIDKAIKGPFDLYKAGQGISAWSKEAHTFFCLGFRTMNQALIRGLKKNVIYDNGMSEEETMQQVGAILSDTPEVAVNAVIDAAACDSGQNRFTMAIERTIYERLGISKLFLDWYFSFREKYKLDSGFIKASVEYVKTSGEPGTLLGNTVLMMALMNSILRGDGPFAMVGKGDDGLKRQANMHYEESLVKLVGRNCPLQFKVDINVPVQFCGYALSGNQLVPCVLRKLIKCASHGFRDYEHFTEYQTSLRDWMIRLHRLREDGVNVLGVNRTIYDVEEGVVESWLESIDSLSHINKSQFYGVARRFHIDFMPPVYDHTLPSEVFKSKFKGPLAERV